MKWVAFISQTGGEVYNIYKNTGIKPLFIVTNNINKVKKEVKDNFTIKVIPNKPTVEDYLSLNIPVEALVTLNGWLRIVPEEIVDKYNIYNGHPGFITKYPELKGKDPQYRAFIGNYKEIGGVIHKVITEVDEGEVLYSDSIKLKGDEELEDYYSILSDIQLNLWCKFFRDYTYSNKW